MILLRQSNNDQKDIWKLALYKHDIHHKRTKWETWQYFISSSGINCKQEIGLIITDNTSVENISLMIIFWIFLKVFCAYFIVFKILHA